MSKKVLKIDSVPDRYCTVCANPIPKVKPSGRNYAVTEYLAHTTCSMKCYGKSRIKPLVGNSCDHCGGDIPHYAASGKKKTFSVYIKQKYCSKSCTPRSRDYVATDKPKHKPFAPKPKTKLYVPHTAMDKFILGVSI